MELDEAFFSECSAIETVSNLRKQINMRDVNIMQMKKKIMDSLPTILTQQNSEKNCVMLEAESNRQKVEIINLKSNHKKLLIEHWTLNKDYQDASKNYNSLNDQFAILKLKADGQDSLITQYKSHCKELETKLEGSLLDLSLLKTEHKENLLKLKTENQSIQKLSSRLAAAKEKKMYHLYNFIVLLGDRFLKDLSASEKRTYKNLKMQSKLLNIKSTPQIKEDPIFDDLDDDELHGPLSCASSIDAGLGSSVYTSDDEKYPSTATTPTRDSCTSPHESSFVLNLPNSNLQSLFENVSGKPKRKRIDCATSPRRLITRSVATSPAKCDQSKKKFVSTATSPVRELLINPLPQLDLKDDIDDLTVKDILNKCNSSFKILSPIPFNKNMDSPHEKPAKVGKKSKIIDSKRIFKKNKGRDKPKSFYNLLAYFSCMTRQLVKKECSQILRNSKASLVTANDQCNVETNQEQKKENVIILNSSSNNECNKLILPNHRGLYLINTAPGAVYHMSTGSEPSSDHKVSLTETCETTNDSHSISSGFTDVLASQTSTVKLQSNCKKKAFKSKLNKSSRKYKNLFESEDEIENDEVNYNDFESTTENENYNYNGDKDVELDVAANISSFNVCDSNKHKRKRKEPDLSISPSQRKDTRRARIENSESKTDSETSHVTIKSKRILEQNTPNMLPHTLVRDVAPLTRSNSDTICSVNLKCSKESKVISKQAENKNSKRSTLLDAPEINAAFRRVTRQMKPKSTKNNLLKSEPLSTHNKDANGHIISDEISTPASKRLKNNLCQDSILSKSTSQIPFNKVCDVKVVNQLNIDKAISVVTNLKLSTSTVERSFIRKPVKPRIQKLPNITIEKPNEVIEEIKEQIECNNSGICNTSGKIECNDETTTRNNSKEGIDKYDIWKRVLENPSKLTMLDNGKRCDDTFESILINETKLLKNKRCGKFVKPIAVCVKVEKYLSCNFTLESLDSFIESINAEKEVDIACAIIEFLSNVNRNGEFIEKSWSSPPMTEHQRHLFILMKRLQSSPPAHYKENLFELVMRGIEFKLFNLKEVPDLSISKYLTQFYTILCMFRKQKDRIKLFCMDALYCLSYKAGALVYSVLNTWPRLLPHFKSPAAKDPLMIVIVHYLLSNFSTKYQYNSENLQKLLLKQYGYKTGTITDDELLKLLLELIQDKSNLFSENLTAAFLLMGKRCGVEWSHKNIILKSLIPIIGDAKNTPTARAMASYLIGPLVLPFPKEMLMQCEVLVKTLTNILETGDDPLVENAIVSSLTHLVKYNFNKIVFVLLHWKPSSPISHQTEARLKTLISKRPVKFWLNFLGRWHPKPTPVEDNIFE